MTRALTPDLICSLATPGEVAISPSGGHVAWTVVPNALESQDSQRSVWVAGVSEAAEPASAWTYGPDDHSPAWSPDGQSLAFLSDRAKRGTNGLYLITVDGRAIRALAVPEQSISVYAWSPSGSDIAVLRASGASAATTDEAVFGADWMPSTIDVVAAGTGDVRRSIVVSDHVTALAWSPDGRSIGVVGQPDPELDSAVAARIGVVDVASVAVRWVCAAPWAESISWLEHENTIAYLAPCESRLLAGDTVWAVSVDGDASPRIIGPDSDGSECVFAIRAQQPATVVTARAAGFDTTVRAFDLVTGEESQWGSIAGDLKTFDIATPSTFAATVQMHGGYREVWAGSLDDLAQRSAHGAALEHTRLGSVTSFVSTSADGCPIDVVTITPPDAAAAPLPTVVLPHGGPYERSNLGVHCAPLDWGQLLATAGYRVLMPNYRGSKGRGHRFAAAATADMGGAEWGDVQSAVDTAVELGLADPARLAIGGWSQGGFLSAWAVTATDRYAAAIVGAGVSDWRMMAATSDMPVFQAALAGGQPWDPAAPSVDHRSPLSFAARVRTPVLILHGQRDERVPVSQGAAFNRALRAAGASVRFVSYPREPHGLRERAHQVDVMNRVLDWVTQHLG